jgi:type IV pilus assembly protein PilB
MARKKLGETLRDRGKISQKDLLEAIEEQAGKAGFLGELLLQRGLVSKTDLVVSLEEVTRTAYVDATSVKVDPKILGLVPLKIARRFCVLPVQIENDKLVIVMLKPQDMLALQELSFASGMHIAPRLGIRDEVEEAINKNYGSTPQEEMAGSSKSRPSSPKIEFNAVSSKQRNLEAVLEFQADLMKRSTPAVVLFSDIVSEAMAKRASDIHIDPQKDSPVVRIRVDGILREMAKVPPRLQDSLVSRIKILADMDISERRAPQDGRLLVTVGEEKRDLRVSTLPTQYGEKVVIRLLDGKSSLVPFKNLGLWEEQADLLTHLLSLPQGLILVTGPTGSGKTTTLYSALNLLRTRNLNIITVEDPVEYRVDGVNQVQVNEKAGRTFAASLRSILRQDPNVIMVGEIRDTETAEIALRAAQTGHMVLSTMHTRDSVSAVARLMELNVPAFLVSASVSAVIAQRLVRKLCKCRAEVAASREYIETLRDAGVCDDARRMYIPVGCPDCDDVGYRGRIGIYELLLFDEAVAEAVRSGGGPTAIRQAAQENGMRSMQEDGLLRAQIGITSLEEVARVVNFKIGRPTPVGSEPRQRVDRKRE